MLNRRKFIRYAFLTTGVVSVGYVGFTSFTPFRNIIIEVLSIDLKGLKVRHEDVEKYATTIAESPGSYFHGTAIKLLSVYSSLPIKILEQPLIGIPVPFEKRYNKARTDLVCIFLLSTDFFTHLNEDREVKYSGIIYGPYRTPCTNPFSGLYHDANKST